jgi:hypothetical protein
LLSSPLAFFHLPEASPPRSSTSLIPCFSRHNATFYQNAHKCKLLFLNNVPLSTLLYKGTVFGNSQRPAHRVVGIDIVGGSAVNGL